MKPTVTVSKKLTSIIERHVTPALAPYDYYIQAPAAGGRTAYQNTQSAVTQLKAWAERLGASVKVRHDTFDKSRSGHVVVEITDPAAQHLDRIIDAQVFEGSPKPPINGRFVGRGTL